MPSIKKSEVATVADALRELRNMQAQIIHGSRIFGDIADILEAESNRLDWIEQEAKKSRTGISFDYGKYAEDGMVLERGFRFMRCHYLGERNETIRKAIDKEMEGHQL